MFLDLYTILFVFNVKTIVPVTSVFSGYVKVKSMIDKQFGSWTWLTNYIFINVLTVISVSQTLEIGKNTNFRSWDPSIVKRRALPWKGKGEGGGQKSHSVSWLEGVKTNLIWDSSHKKCCTTLKMFLNFIFCVVYCINSFKLSWELVSRPI